MLALGSSKKIATDAGTRAEIGLPKPLPSDKEENKLRTALALGLSEKLAFSLAWTKFI